MIVALIIVFFLTSVVSVVTGSTSLITVPAMLLFGIDPHVAVATNMFALTFLSGGATLPFLRTNIIDRRRLPVLGGLTLLGSIMGALLLTRVSADAMPLLIALFMLVIVAFSLVNPSAGITAARTPTRTAVVGGYLATFLLGIYGGFFSGGYVTLLTAVYVALFGMTFLEAVAITKVINLISSLIATGIFLSKGLVDYRLGLTLGITMLLGAIVGARLALRVNNIWLRRIFLATVILLALKTFLYDFVWPLIRGT